MAVEEGQSFHRRQQTVSAVSCRHDRQGRVTPRRVPGGRNRGASLSQPSREWIGGRLSPPFFIHDRPEPYRPDLVLWMELPAAFVVGQAVVMPENTNGAVARTLRRALTQPAGGSPRRPDLIRVADAATAAEVRAEVAGAIPVTVAPTPELDELLQHLIATMPASQDDEPSYFVGGSVSNAAVEKLFTASSSLFALKPWTVVNAAQVLRMDIPALGGDGACLSIIGQLDESRGVLIFPSLDGFEQFRNAAETGAVERGSIALGTALLSLTFKPATELPPSMRREAMEHGWPVESADAYPLVAHREPDGRPRPLVERDVLRQARGDLHVGHFRARLRVVLRRRRSGGAVHRSLRSVRGLRPDGLHGTRARGPRVAGHPPGTARRAIPATGRPQRTLSVR